MEKTEKYLRKRTRFTDKEIRENVEITLMEVESLMEGYHQEQLKLTSVSKSLIAFNNEFARYQDNVPSELKIKWNELLKSNL